MYGYTQRMAIKDELALMTGIRGKMAQSYANERAWSTAPRKPYEFKSIDLTLVFETREDIYAIDDTTLVSKSDDLTIIDFARYWTGSSFDGTKLELCQGKNKKPLDREWESDTKSQPYLEKLTLKQPLKLGEELHIRTRTTVKDAIHIMNPYFAQMVQIRTKALTLCIKTKGDLVKDMKLTVYADDQMSPEMIFDQQKIKGKEEDGFIVYKVKIPRPNLNYSYCLEWQFA